MGNGTAPWCLLVAVAAGCGRYAFDPTGDGSGAVCVPAGHDEDGDTVDDGCDDCPHIVDPGQGDADGDGVGDACDPQPAVAAERILFFDPFVTIRSEWTSQRVMTVNNDQLVITAGFNSYLLPVTPGRVLYSFGGRIGADVGEKQLFLGMLTAGRGVYYCELFDFTGAKFSLTYTYDFMSYGFMDSVVVPSPVENGPVTMTMINDPQSTSCTTTWPNTRPLAGTAPADLTSPETFEMKIAGIDATIDYFIEIGTTP